MTMSLTSRSGLADMSDCPQMVSWIYEVVNLTLGLFNLKVESIMKILFVVFIGLPVFAVTVLLVTAVFQLMR